MDSHRSFSPPISAPACHQQSFNFSASTLAVVPPSCPDNFTAGLLVALATWFHGQQTQNNEDRRCPLPSPSCVDVRSSISLSPAPPCDDELNAADLRSIGGPPSSSSLLPPIAGDPRQRPYRVSTGDFQGCLSTHLCRPICRLLPSPTLFATAIFLLRMPSISSSADLQTNCVRLGFTWRSYWDPHLRSSGLGRRPAYSLATCFNRDFASDLRRPILRPGCHRCCPPGQVGYVWPLLLLGRRLQQSSCRLRKSGRLLFD